MTDFTKFNLHSLYVFILPALLNIRLRNEAKRLEAQRQEQMAAEGVEGQVEPVEPGTVDWLYGENMKDLPPQDEVEQEDTTEVVTSNKWSDDEDYRPVSDP